MSRRAAVLALIILAACQDETRDRPVSDGGQPVPQAASGESGSSAPDSMVLDLGSATVWHTLSRQATSASGEPCLERTLEIRRAGAEAPVRVPLLYTRDVPEVIDDSTLEARVYRDCAPGDRYRIHMRTGQPTPVR